MKNLITRAQQLRQHKKTTIVLPESTEPRILAAAARAAVDDIATCTLLGEEAPIKHAAQTAGLTLPLGENLSIHPPAAALQHAPLLVKLRADKGKPVSEDSARAMLENPLAAAAMLVRAGAANGMVAGAVTTSADVLRPALQIVGLRAGAAIASSAFLMGFADGIKIFADCALNIAPAPEQLAQIARQSADTARAFGITPVIAMLSYASGSSGSGEQVSRVAAAAAQARALLPDVPLTGPVQYDAAVSPRIARTKLPQDPAAGRATVLIFPDLQSGNIAYKAVQQAAAIISVGPLMQGLAAPVNDLSRGATAEDIYHTLAATTIQTHPTPT